MAGGIVETDPERLAKICDNFKKGAQCLHNDEGDMWFFELYHHLTDCAAALRKAAIKQAGEKAQGDVR